MQNKINRKVELYLEKYRETVKEKILNSDLNIDLQTQNKLLEVLYSYDTLYLEEDDFMKRKRIVTNVPVNNRCNAKKASGDQCTRKKRDGCEFCGTHDKFQPHGIICNDIQKEVFKKCNISILDVNGINYYIDDNNNVYDTADILLNSSNPKIIGIIDIKSGKNEFIER